MWLDINTRLSLSLSLPLSVCRVTIVPPPPRFPLVTWPDLAGSDTLTQSSVLSRASAPPGLLISKTCKVNVLHLSSLSPPSVLPLSGHHQPQQPLDLRKNVLAWGQREAGGDVTVGRYPVTPVLLDSCLASHNKCQGMTLWCNSQEAFYKQHSSTCIPVYADQNKIYL